LHLPISWQTIELPHQQHDDANYTANVALWIDAVVTTHPPFTTTTSSPPSITLTPHPAVSQLLLSNKRAYQITEHRLLRTLQNLREDANCEILQETPTLTLTRSLSFSLTVALLYAQIDLNDVYEAAEMLTSTSSSTAVQFSCSCHFISPLSSLSLSLSLSICLACAPATSVCTFVCICQIFVYLFLYGNCLACKCIYVCI